VVLASQIAPYFSLPRSLFRRVLSNFLIAHILKYIEDTRMPAKLHLTVPPGFRRSSPIPRVLQLHRAKLAAQDIIKLRGFAATRALRAILDLSAAQSVSLDIIRQAFEEGTRRGLITLAELEHAKTLPGLHPDLADLLRTP
jgi:hypothetical protein